VAAHGADDTGPALTELADAAVTTALDLLEPSIPFVVVAMGRYGGRGLSYGSDLDVVFVYDVDATSAAAAAEADRVATGFIRLLRGTTPAERIWDVDAGLRPEGKDGPLARSLDGFASYLEQWAQPWERQAMTQARPVAGPADLQQRFSNLVVPWVTSGLSSDGARQIRRLKARVERERIPPDQDPEFHLKLGRGSLSDIEWTAQLLQLQHRVACSGTITTLKELVDTGALSADDAAPLVESYRFCEHTRNRLFLTDGPTAGDALPARPERLTVLARSLETTAPALREDYRRVTRRARRVVERLFYERS
jgi:glutamate-ammonia-ligase adenylyltransferase